MLKKVLGIVCAASLAVTALTGCNGGGETAGVPEGATKVTVWSSQTGTKAAYDELVAEWNDTVGKKEGIYIDYVCQNTDYMTIVETSAQNGTLPDLLIVNGSKKKYAKQGFIVPLTDLPGGAEFLEEYGDTPIEGTEMFDGNVYFLNARFTTIGLIYNADMFRKYGVVDENGNPKVPTTWDEYVETAKALTHPEDQAYGVGIPLKYSGFSSWSVDKPCFVTETEKEFNMDTLTYDYSYLIPGLKALQQIKADESYFPGPNSLDNDTMRAQFAAGRIGMYIGASYDVGVLDGQFESQCDWEVAPVPVAEGKTIAQDAVSLGSGFCVSNNASKNDMEKVMTVFKWLHSVELQKELYERGLDIPFRAEARETADTSNMSKQWVQFGELLTGNLMRYRKPSFATEGTTLQDAVEGVWAGTFTPEAAAQARAENSNAGLKKAIDKGEINPADYK